MSESFSASYLQGLAQLLPKIDTEALEKAIDAIDNALTTMGISRDGLKPAA